MSITVCNSEGRKITYGYDDIRYNPIGIFVTRGGELYQAPFGSEKIDIDKRIIPSISENGYLYITEKDVENLRVSLKQSVVDGMFGEVIDSCEFVHRIVVFSFGDKDGRDFNKYKRTMRYEIDHINMNKADPRVENLQLVSKGVNLFRAYYNTANSNGKEYCKKRFKDYYDKLDEIDKMILDKEILLDLEGKY